MELPNDIIVCCACTLHKMGWYQSSLCVRFISIAEYNGAACSLWSLAIILL